MSYLTKLPRHIKTAITNEGNRVKSELDNIAARLSFQRWVELIILDAARTHLKELVPSPIVRISVTKPEGDVYVRIAEVA